MPDVFLSYNREDQATARRFAEAFAAAGLEVWWDDALRSGEAYDEVTEGALKTAKAVVVLWSPRSVVSRWVRAEATLADRNKTLLPVTIEACERPIMFELTQTADLTGWDGAVTDRAWQAFLGDVRRFVRGEGASAAATAAPTPGPERLSICVLPFVNMSGDPEQEYFSDGLSEELLNQLAQLKGLKVSARTSCFAFKGLTPEPKAVGEKLGVAHVLEGSVRKAGNRLRITAQLIKTGDGFHLWSETFNRELDDVFQIQEDIARAVADALKITLGMDQSTLPPGGTRNPEAYDVYLRAQAWARQASVPATQRSIGFYREAVRLDPDFAMAWLGLALIYANASIMHPGGDDWIRLSEEAFERAIASAPDAPMIHAVQGTQLFLAKRDWIGAGEAFERAAGLAPAETLAGVGDNSNVGFPFFLAAVGRMTESIEFYRLAVRADPLATMQMFQFTLDCQGRFDEAEADYRRVMALPIDPALSEYFGLLRSMAREDAATVKVKLGRYWELGHHFMPVHGEILAHFDDRTAVAGLLRKAFEDATYQDAARLNGIASMAAYMGDDDLALAALRRAFVDMKGVQVAGIWHPVFARAHRTPAFGAIARDLGLADYWRASGKWGDFARPVGKDDFEIIR